MQRRNAFAATVVFAVLGAPPTAHAEEGIARCVAIEAADARLACFDEVTGRTVRTEKPARPDASGVAPAPAPPASTAPAVAATPAAGSDDFGLPAEQPQKGPTRITAVVRSVDPHPHVGRWVVTLDNGQVWEQRETSAPAKRPRPGDPVTIEEASFGSYLMVVQGRGSSRVKRIR